MERPAKSDAEDAAVKRGLLRNTGKINAPATDRYEAVQSAAAASGGNFAYPYAEPVRWFAR
jgi:hypothetical protein